MDHNRNGITVVEILPHDVLLGRGKTVHNHIGNIEYRKEVKDRALDYQRQKGMDKDAVAREVIEAVQRMGGRFLRLAEEHGSQWELCPSSIVLTKVKQALRDILKPKVPPDEAKLPATRDSSMALKKQSKSKKSASNKRKRAPEEARSANISAIETSSGGQISDRLLHDDMRTRNHSQQNSVDPSQQMLHQLMAARPSPAIQMHQQQNLPTQLQTELMFARRNINPLQLAALRSQQQQLDAILGVPPVHPLLMSPSLFLPAQPVAPPLNPQSLAVLRHQLQQQQQRDAIPSSSNETSATDSSSNNNPLSSSSDAQILELLRRLRR